MGGAGEARRGVPLRRPGRGGVTARRRTCGASRPERRPARVRGRDRSRTPRRCRGGACCAAAGYLHCDRPRGGRGIPHGRPDAERTAGARRVRPHPGGARARAPSPPPRPARGPRASCATAARAHHSARALVRGPPARRRAVERKRQKNTKPRALLLRHLPFLSRSCTRSCGCTSGS